MYFFYFFELKCQNQKTEYLKIYVGINKLHVIRKLMNQRKLLIIRHAKSDWGNRELEDHDRPLNERGMSNAPEMADRLKNLKIIPDAFFSSTALRAACTAKSFAQQLNFPDDKIHYDHDLYLASAGMLQDYVAQLDNSLGTVLIFSHNPGVTLLVSQVWKLNIGNIPTCGIVSLEFNNLDWEKASFNLPTSATFDFPKNSTGPISFPYSK